MKLTTVDVSDFRSIKRLNLQCKPGINIIAGVNGAGKSTLLDAIEILLSWVKARIRVRNASGAYPEYSDISRGGSIARLRAEALCPGPVDWEVVRISPAYRGAERPKSDLARLTAFTDSVAADYYSVDGEYDLPMIVKYSVNRSLIDIPVHVHKKHVLDAMSLYEGKIDGGSNLRSFYEWFREREDIEREERDERRSFDYEDSQLKAVRRAISSVMAEFGELHTRRKSPVGFELRKNGEIFRVEELSDGEKCYMTLMGDIARRLAICNPAMQDPLQGSGIVLIDELELHLHPKWQAEAIDKLKAVFPNCQFFISTHSPHVVQNLMLDGNDSLTVLADGRVYNVAMHYGQPIGDVLGEVFGLSSLRPGPVEQLIDKVWAHLKNGEYESAPLEAALDELKALITDHDAEFARINMQRAINRKSH